MIKSPLVRVHFGLQGENRLLWMLQAVRAERALRPLFSEAAGGGGLDRGPTRRAGAGREVASDGRRRGGLLRAGRGGQRGARDVLEPEGKSQ